VILLVLNQQMLRLLEFIYRRHGATLDQLEARFNDAGLLPVLAELVTEDYLSGFNPKAEWREVDGGEDEVINLDLDFSKLPFSVPRTAWFQTRPKGDAVVEKAIEKRNEIRRAWLRWWVPLFISVIALVMSGVSLAMQLGWLPKI